MRICHLDFFLCLSFDFKGYRYSSAIKGFALGFAMRKHHICQSEIKMFFIEAL